MRSHNIFETSRSTIYKYKNYFLFFTSIIPSTYFLWMILYPTYVCKGEFTNFREWHSHADPNSIKILDNDKMIVYWPLTISRNSIRISETEFPLRPSIKDSKNFAEKTKSGYKGKISVDFIHQIEAEFLFDKTTSQLGFSVTGKGLHLIDGVPGEDRVKSKFIGLCEKKWF